MCTTVTIGCLVFLCSLCVVWMEIGYGLASITCTTTGKLNSTCHPSDTCYEEHSIPEQREECENKLLHINKTVSFSGYNITECDRSYIGFYRCNAVKMNLDGPYLVKSLSYTAITLDAKYFSLDFSWTWFDEDFRRARHQLVGYELRISSDSEIQRTIKCLCIWEPFLLNISLGFDPVLQYRTSSFKQKEDMKFALFTLPYEENWLYELYSVKKDMPWPITCQSLDIADVHIFCPVRLPSAPTSLSIVSRLSENVTKELNISWINESDAPPPSQTYYATVFDNFSNITLTFVVTGSRNIKISGLQESTNYSVQVQVYSLCSGISMFYSNSSRDIGCGAWSDSSKEYFPVSTTSSPVPMNSTGYTTFRTNSVLLIASTSIMASLILAIVLVVLLSVSIFFYDKRHRRGIKPDPNPLQFVHPLSQLDALVLYSQGTPMSEQIEIEQYVVFLLKQAKLNVLSCNDHTAENTIVQWVEEKARSAHTVFIVCNQHFCNEWGMRSGTPLINSLQMIIDSAVSQKSIKKYATVLLKPSDEQYIPDHLYLKGMKSFVVGACATPGNRAEFISFIKIHRLLNY